METYTPFCCLGRRLPFISSYKYTIRFQDLCHASLSNVFSNRTFRHHPSLPPPPPTSLSSASYSFSSFSALFSFGLYRRSISFHAIPFLSNECTRAVPRFRSINPRSNPEDYIRIFPVGDRAGRKDEGEEVIKRGKNRRGKSRLIA